MVYNAPWHTEAWKRRKAMDATEGVHGIGTNGALSVNSIQTFHHFHWLPVRINRRHPGTEFPSA